MDCATNCPQGQASVRSNNYIHPCMNGEILDSHHEIKHIVLLGLIATGSDDWRVIRTMGSTWQQMLLVRNAIRGISRLNQIFFGWCDDAVLGTMISSQWRIRRSETCEVLGVTELRVLWHIPSTPLNETG